MKPAAVVSLIVGLGVLVVFGLCLVGGTLFFFGRQKTQSIVNAMNEGNRCISEMQAAVNSNPQGMARVHAITTEIPRMTLRMRAIDTSRCPPDFQQSYLRYIQAWEGLGQKLTKLPQNNPQLLLEATAAALSAKTGVGVGNQLAKANDEISAQTDVVRAAWDDVEATALRYGVHVK